MAKSKAKILIVEDESALCQVLEDTFKEEGFSVDTAKDGEEGLKKAQKGNPDLIILDVILPKMDGMELLKKLKSDEAGKNTKVIMLTNSDSPDNVFESLNYGATDYLTKADWQLEDLVAKVKERLNIKE
ncbi:MAG: response regulator [Candidatus Saccharimonadales bacterium]